MRLTLCRIFDACSFETEIFCFCRAFARHDVSDRAAAGHHRQKRENDAVLDDFARRDGEESPAKPAFGARSQNPVPVDKTRF